MVRLAKQSWPQSRPSSWKNHIHPWLPPTCAHLCQITENGGTNLSYVGLVLWSFSETWWVDETSPWTMGIVKGISRFWLVNICLTVISTQLLPSTLYVSACSPAKRLGKLNRVHVVWVCLSDPLDDTLRPRNLFCGELLHFHRYSDVCKWSSYPTFIVMLSRTPIVVRSVCPCFRFVAT